MRKFDIEEDSPLNIMLPLDVDAENITYEGVEVLDEVLDQPEADEIIEEKVMEPPEMQIEFPVKSINDVERLERELGQPNSAYKTKILELLLGTRVESKGHKFAIRAIFRAVYEYSVMAKYCWLGNEKKRPLYLLRNTMKFFKAVITNWYPGWPEEDFMLSVRHFLKNCPSRQGIKHWQRRDT